MTIAVVEALEAVPNAQGQEEQRWWANLGSTNVGSVLAVEELAPKLPHVIAVR